MSAKKQIICSPYFSGDSLFTSSNDIFDVKRNFADDKTTLLRGEDVDVSSCVLFLKLFRFNNYVHYADLVPNIIEFSEVFACFQ